MTNEFLAASDGNRFTRPMIGLFYACATLHVPPPWHSWLTIRAAAYWRPIHPRIICRMLFFSRRTWARNARASSASSRSSVRLAAAY